MLLDHSTLDTFQPVSRTILARHKPDDNQTVRVDATVNHDRRYWNEYDVYINSDSTDSDLQNRAAQIVAETKGARDTATLKIHDNDHENPSYEETIE